MSLTFAMVALVDFYKNGAAEFESKATMSHIWIRNFRLELTRAYGLLPMDPLRGQQTERPAIKLFCVPLPSSLPQPII